MQQPNYSISTPENVDLHLELAGIGNRVLAALIDTTITYAIILVLGLLFWGAITVVGLTDLSEKDRSLINNLISMVAIFFVFVINFGYFILFEGLWQGQTPGKKIVSIRVIETNGQPVGWSAVVLRNLIRTLDTGLAFVGLLPMIIDRNEKRFGDYAAGTIVVRERKADMLSEDFILSEIYNTEAIDAGRITPQEYALLLGFLKRRTNLAKSQRPLIAGNLATYMRKKLDDTSTEPAEKFLERVYSAYKARAES
ncbi:RDD family protein [soil metagenome]